MRFKTREGSMEEPEGDRERKRVYADLFSQGYTFQTNCPIKEINSRVKKYRTEGLEVFVGEKAFWQDGRIDHDMRTILIKKRNSITHTY